MPEVLLAVGRRRRRSTSPDQMKTLPSTVSTSRTTSDVAELPAGPEPLRPGQHLDDGRPHQHAGREEGQVLERVDGAVRDRGLVQRRQVPEVEAEPPRAAGRRAGARGARSGASQGTARSGRSSGPVSPSTNASAREVAEQDVLEHVDEEELVLERRQLRRRGERDPEREARLPPARDRRRRARASVRARRQYMTATTASGRSAVRAVIAPY